MSNTTFRSGKVSLPLIANRICGLTSTELETDRILCNDVTFDGEYNPHRVRPWVIGHVFGAVALVWATCEQDALDVAYDADLLNCFSVDEADYAKMWEEHKGEFYGSIEAALKQFDHMQDSQADLVSLLVNELRANDFSQDHAAEIAELIFESFKTSTDPALVIEKLKSDDLYGSLGVSDEFDDPCAHLGNAGEPCKLDDCWMAEVSLKECPLPLLLAFAEARGACANKLSDI